MSLTKIMKEKKIKSKDLAEKTGINQRTLEGYRIGRGKLSLENGLKIAEVLEIDPHDLLEEE